jgi:hypothetical protein
VFFKKSRGRRGVMARHSTKMSKCTIGKVLFLHSCNVKDSFYGFVDRIDFSAVAVFEKMGVLLL